MTKINMKKIFLKIAVGILLLQSGFSSVAEAQSDFLTKFREYREKFQTASKSEQEKKFKEIDKEISQSQNAEDKKLLLMAKALLAKDHGKSEEAQNIFQDLLKEKNNLHEYVH